MTEPTSPANDDDHIAGGFVFLPVYRLGDVPGMPVEPIGEGA